jgi:hypothetical protein
VITTAIATNVSTRPRIISERQLTATVSTVAKRRNVATNSRSQRGVAAATTTTITITIGSRSTILIS